MRFTTRRLLTVALASTLLVPATAPAAIAADPPGPIARWTFDEGAGGTAADASGNGHTGTLSGATWLTSGAKQGSGAIQLDGVDDVVTVPDSPGLEPADAFSILAWVRPAAGRLWQTVVQKGSNGCEGGSYGAFVHTFDDPELGNPDAGMAQALDRTPTGGSRGTNSPTTTLADGGWHLVGVTRDSTGVLRTWLDGAFFEAWETPVSGYGLSSEILTIGRSATPCDSFGGRYLPFAGAIDDVRIYDRALPASEILAMLPTYETSIDVDWPAGSIQADGDVPFAVTVEPAPVTGGWVRLWRETAGDRVFLRDAPIEYGTTTAQLSLPGYSALPPGTHAVYVEFSDGGMALDSRSETHEVEVHRVAHEVDIEAADATRFVGQDVSVTVTSHSPTDTIELWGALGAGTAALLESTAASQDGATWKAVFTFDDLALGTWTFSGVAAETTYRLEGESGTTTVEVSKRPTTTLIEATGSGQANHPYTVAVSVRPSLDGDPTVLGGGTVTLQDGATTLGSAPLVEGAASFAIPSFTEGSHELTASWSGTTHYAGSSTGETLVIGGDTVDATDVGVQYPAFYPVKDGYRDTVQIRGTRAEPISVVAKIYKPSGSLLRTITFPMGTDGYAFTWTGRTSSGKLLPTGRYTVVQVLEDAAGTKRTVTSSVTLSAKEIVLRSATLTQSFGEVDAGGFLLGWVGWRFKLPDAATYKSLQFGVYGRTNGKALFGPHKFSYGGSCESVGSWDRDCASPREELGGSDAWHTVKGLAGGNRNGNIAKLYVWVSAGKASIDQGRVRVTYGVLR